MLDTRPAAWRWQQTQQRSCTSTSKLSEVPAIERAMKGILLLAITVRSKHIAGITILEGCIHHHHNSAIDDANRLLSVVVKRIFHLLSGGNWPDAEADEHAVELSSLDFDCTLLDCVLIICFIECGPALTAPPFVSFSAGNQIPGVAGPHPHLVDGRHISNLQLYSNHCKLSICNGSGSVISVSHLHLQNLFENTDQSCGSEGCSCGWETCTKSVWYKNMVVS
jgi:hypothetical protein